MYVCVYFAGVEDLPEVRGTRAVWVARNSEVEGKDVCRGCEKLLVVEGLPGVWLGMLMVFV